MISFFATFTAYLVLYKYTALFLIVLSGFILPVPVNEIILVAGAFASQGYMSVLAVMAIALFTNIGVDILGYSLTYRFGDDILRILRIRKDATFYRVRKYLENYASGTIYFGAIVGPFRPLINFISGLMRLPFRRFVLFDFLGNASSVIFFVLSGYLVGNYWRRFLTELWLFALVPIILFIIYVVYKTRFRDIDNIKD